MIFRVFCWLDLNFHTFFMVNYESTCKRLMQTIAFKLYNKSLKHLKNINAQLP